MSYCKQCGNEIKPGEKFCTNCGTAAEDSVHKEGYPIICHKCGEKIMSTDKTCKYCGVTVDTTKAERAKTAVVAAETGIFKRRIVLASAAGVFILVLCCVIYISTVGGRISRAGWAEKVGDYQKAYDIVSELDGNRSDVAAYQKYYNFMLKASMLENCTYTAFKTNVFEMRNLRDSMTSSAFALENDEMEKVNTICSILSEYDAADRSIDVVAEGLKEMSEVSDQIESFKNGESYTPKAICSKAEKWKETLDEANAAYSSVRTGMDLPSYSEVSNEITEMISDMKSSEYYDKTGVYYKKYSNSYVNPYTEEHINVIQEEMKASIIEKFGGRVATVL